MAVCTETLHIKKNESVFSPKVFCPPVTYKECADAPVVTSA